MSSTSATSLGPTGSLSPALDLNGTLGAGLIGLIISAILFGLTSAQVCTYYPASVRDPRYMKLSITFLWLLDAVHLALVSHIMYFYLVTNFADVAAITKLPWSFGSHVLIEAISDLTVRCFYIRRLWILSKQNRLLTSGLVALTGLIFVIAILCSVKLVSYNSASQVSNLSWAIYTYVALSVAAELWNAALLCYFLAKNRTGFKTTDTRIGVLVTYTINTGLFTSICTVCCLITYATMPKSFIYIAIYFVLPKLYLNALLAMLNSRDVLRTGGSLSTYGNDNGVGASVYQMQRIIAISANSSPHHPASFEKPSASHSARTNPSLSSEEKCADV